MENKYKHLTLEALEKILEDLTVKADLNQSREFIAYVFCPVAGGMVRLEESALFHEYMKKDIEKFYGE